MITLLPAMLVIFGRWVFWPRVPVRLAASRPPRVLAGSGQRIAAGPRSVWIVTALLLAVAALDVVKLKADGLPRPSRSAAPRQRGRPEGAGRALPGRAGSPVIVVGPARQAEAITATVAARPGIAGLAAEPETADGLVQVQATLTDAPDSQAVRDGPAPAGRRSTRRAERQGRRSDGDQPRRAGVRASATTGCSSRSSSSSCSSS